MPIAVPIPLPPPPRAQKMKPNVSSSVNGDSAPVTSITNGHVLHTDDLTSNLTKRGATNGHANGNGYVSHNEDAQTDVPDGAVTSALKRSTVHATIDWEIPRKVFHSSIGCFTLPLYFLQPDLRLIIQALAIFLVIVVTADYIRLRNASFERLYEKLLGPLMRECEKDGINGVVWYLVGVLWVLKLYPRDVAVVSILILSWADTAASTFGRLYGSRTGPLPASVRVPFLPSGFNTLRFSGRKSIAGALGAFGTGALIAIGFWGWCGWAIGGDGTPPVWVWDEAARGGLGGWFGLTLFGAGVGAAASVAEALDLGWLDDNMTLPILGGGATWAIAVLLNLFR